MQRGGGTDALAKKALGHLHQSAADAHRQKPRQDSARQQQQQQQQQQFHQTHSALHHQHNRNRPALPNSHPAQSNHHGAGANAAALHHHATAPTVPGSVPSSQYNANSALAAAAAAASYHGAAGFPLASHLEAYQAAAAAGCFPMVPAAATGQDRQHSAQQLQHHQAAAAAAMTVHDPRGSALHDHLWQNFSEATANWPPFPPLVMPFPFPPFLPPQPPAYMQVPPTASAPLQHPPRTVDRSHHSVTATPSSTSTTTAPPQTTAPPAAPPNPEQSSRHVSPMTSSANKNNVYQHPQPQPPPTANIPEGFVLVPASSLRALQNHQTTLPPPPASACPDLASPHTTGTHTAGAHTTGTHNAGTHTTGTHNAGTHTTGTHAASTHTTAKNSSNQPAAAGQRRPPPPPPPADPSPPPPRHHNLHQQHQSTSLSGAPHPPSTDPGPAGMNGHTPTSTGATTGRHTTGSALSGSSETKYRQATRLDRRTWHRPSPPRQDAGDSNRNRAGMGSGVRRDGDVVGWRHRSRSAERYSAAGRSRAAEKQHLSPRRKRSSPMVSSNMTPVHGSGAGRREQGLGRTSGEPMQLLEVRPPVTPPHSGDRCLLPAPPQSNVGALHPPPPPPPAPPAPPAPPRMTTSPMLTTTIISSLSSAAKKAATSTAGDSSRPLPLIIRPSATAPLLDSPQPPARMHKFSVAGVTNTARRAPSICRGVVGRVGRRILPPLDDRLDARVSLARFAHRRPPLDELIQRRRARIYRGPDGAVSSGTAAGIGASGMNSTGTRSDRGILSTVLLREENDPQKYRLLRANRGETSARSLGSSEMVKRGIERSGGLQQPSASFTERSSLTSAVDDHSHRHRPYHRLHHPSHQLWPPGGDHATHESTGHQHHQQASHHPNSPRGTRYGDDEGQGRPPRDDLNELHHRHCHITDNSTRDGHDTNLRQHGNSHRLHHDRKSSPAVDRQLHGVTSAGKSTSQTYLLDDDNTSRGTCRRISDLNEARAERTVTASSANRPVEGKAQIDDRRSPLVLNIHQQQSHQQQSHQQQSHQQQSHQQQSHQQQQQHQHYHQQLSHQQLVRRRRDEHDNPLPHNNPPQSHQQRPLSAYRDHDDRDDDDRYHRDRQNARRGHFLDTRPACPAEVPSRRDHLPDLVAPSPRLASGAARYVNLSPLLEEHQDKEINGRQLLAGRGDHYNDESDEGRHRRHSPSNSAPIGGRRQPSPWGGEPSLMRRGGESPRPQTIREEAPFFIDLDNHHVLHRHPSRREYELSVAHGSAAETFGGDITPNRSVESSSNRPLSHVRHRLTADGDDRNYISQRDHSTRQSDSPLPRGNAQNPRHVDAERDAEQRHERQLLQRPTSDSRGMEGDSCSRRLSHSAAQAAGPSGRQEPRDDMGGNDRQVNNHSKDELLITECRESTAVVGPRVLKSLGQGRVTRLAEMRGQGNRSRWAKKKLLAPARVDSKMASRSGKGGRRRRSMSVMSMIMPTVKFSSMRPRLRTPPAHRVAARRRCEVNGSNSDAVQRLHEETPSRLKADDQARRQGSTSGRVKIFRVPEQQQQLRQIMVASSEQFPSANGSRHLTPDNSRLEGSQRQSISSGGGMRASGAEYAVGGTGGARAFGSPGKGSRVVLARRSASPP